eukprot:CAMPEP_0197049736 /NCGR_PEP_ID=MMETSP1384-20130603/24802_1 /TAXON_ID=29189 /ORGANISM="Ammonia sp." /LENGTH=330 /DNA_ID=CAMNT_0042482061 /DNA_START=22 /DNA_END=1010 /DNA_ORIENTATION=-
MSTETVTTNTITATLATTPTIPTRRKRSKLPVSFTKDSSSTPEPSPKKHKTSEARKQLQHQTYRELVPKLHAVAARTEMNDITFSIVQNERASTISGIRAMFAAHSKVMLDEFCRSKAKVITVNDVTVSAFQFLKEYTHFYKTHIPNQHIVDILFAAQKYKMCDLEHQCRKLIKSEIADLDTLYQILEAMGKYETNEFGDLQEVIDTRFVNEHLQTIMDDTARFNQLAVYQVQWFLQRVPASLGNTKPYTQFLYARSYSEVRSRQTEDWKSYFDSHFRAMIHFAAMSVKELMLIRTDAVFTDDALIDWMAEKNTNLERTVVELELKNKNL